MTKFLFFLVNFIFSLFLYSNVYEKLFFVDLPYVPSITKFPMPAKVFAERNSNNTNSQGKWAGFYGQPKSIRLPKLKMSLDIEKPTFQDNAALVTNLSAYYYTFSKSYSGLLGNTLIFAPMTVRPFDYIGLLVEGDRVVITTDKEWNYTYKVSKKQIVNSVDDLYMDLDSKLPKLVMYKVVGPTSYLVVEGDYLSVTQSGNTYGD